MKTLLWLDDVRDPMDKQVDWLVFSPIGRDCNIVWVKSFSEFKDYFNKNYYPPTAICFDHDLGTEETGYDAAKWLVDYCIDFDFKLPIFASQSANPVGRENILTYLKNYLKHYEKTN